MVYYGPQERERCSVERGALFYYILHCNRTFLLRRRLDELLFIMFVFALVQVTPYEVMVVQGRGKTLALDFISICVDACFFGDIILNFCLVRIT